MKTISSDEFKKIFLLTFTKELIINSKRTEFISLQNAISLKEERKKTVLVEKKIIPQRSQLEIPAIKEKISVVPLKPNIQQIQQPKKNIPVQRQNIARLRIPETQLPPHLAYLKPTLVDNQTLTDWEKLNPLIKDNAVRAIEVNANQKVRVSGSMGERATNIILNSEEINEIINKFAYASRIPASEGVYKVVVENLIFFAVISSVVGSRFVIQKIQPRPPENVYPNPYAGRY